MTRKYTWNGTIYLSPHDNIFTIPLIAKLYLYTVAPVIKATCVFCILVEINQSKTWLNTLQCHTILIILVQVIILVEMMCVYLNSMRIFHSLKCALYTNITWICLSCMCRSCVLYVPRLPIWSSFKISIRLFSYGASSS